MRMWRPGCLEQYASATAICRAATRAAARGGADRIAKLIARRIEGHGEFTSRDLAGLAREGDEPSRQIFAEQASTWAWAWRCW